MTLLRDITGVIAGGILLVIGLYIITKVVTFGILRARDDYAKQKRKEDNNGF